MDDDRVFELRKGEQLLATLIEVDLDFPWYICRVEPTPAFEAYRPLFVEGTELPDGDEYHNAWNEWFERVTQARLTIVQLDNGKVARDFIPYVYGERFHFRAIFEDS